MGLVRVKPSSLGSGGGGGAGYSPADRFRLPNGLLGRSMSKAQLNTPSVLRTGTKPTAGQLRGVPVSTFRSGTIKRCVTKADIEAFRFSGGGADPIGRYLTDRSTLRLINLKSPASAISVLKLPKGSTATDLNRFVIPKGSEIFIGGVKAGHPGAIQIFIKNPNILK